MSAYEPGDVVTHNGDGSTRTGTVLFLSSADGSTVVVNWCGDPDPIKAVDLSTIEYARHLTPTGTTAVGQSWYDAYAAKGIS